MSPSRWALLGGAVCAALGWLAAAWVWDGLPDPMPTHYGVDGEADGFMPRWVGVSVMPVLSWVLPAFVIGVTRLDPRADHVASSEGPVAAIAGMTAVFLLGVQGVMLQSALSADQVLDDRLVFAMVGLLWMGLGVAMPRVSSNWFVGVRTPWTLASDEVWKRTHHLAGRLFVLAGVVMIGSTLLSDPGLRLGVLLVAALGSAFAPVAASYVWWRRERATE